MYLDCLLQHLTAAKHLPVTRNTHNFTYLRICPHFNHMATQHKAELQAIQLYERDKLEDSTRFTYK